jgi:hypothetical protein
MSFNSDPFFYEYSGFELTGSVPIIKDKVDKFFGYEIHISYNNHMSSRTIMQVLKVNITLNDTVINLRNKGVIKDSLTLKPFENKDFCGELIYNKEGSFDRININDDLFFGPVQSYNVKYLSDGNETKKSQRYETIPFLLLNSNFAEYQEVLDHYGKLLQMEKFDNIVVLLTAKYITILVFEDLFRVLASEKLYYKCSSMSKHNLKRRLAMLCTNETEMSGGSN